MRSLIGLPKRHMSFVVGIPILEDGLLEGVDVKVTVAADIASDQSLGSFDTDFSSTVTVGKCYGAETMVDAPGP